MNEVKIVMFEKLYEKYMAFEAPVEKEHPIILGILRYLENTNVKYSQAASGINMTVALDKNTFM